MPTSAQDHYLTTEVFTATPQKLHLMLVEAAIRSCERARRHWLDGTTEKAGEALIHAQNIITEMLTQLNHEGSPALSKKVAAVYLFVFRSLMEANVQRDEAKLDGALKVLEIERDTWRRVCEKSGSSEAARSAGKVSSSTERAGPVGPVFDMPDAGEETRTGFSMEA